MGVGRVDGGAVWRDCVRHHRHRLLPLVPLVPPPCLLCWHVILSIPIDRSILLSCLLLVVGRLMGSRLALLRVGVIGAVLPCVLPCRCILLRIGVGQKALVPTLPAWLGSRRGRGGGVL